MLLHRRSYGQEQAFNKKIEQTVGVQEQLYFFNYYAKGEEVSVKSELSAWDISPVTMQSRTAPALLN